MDGSIADRERRHAQEEVAKAERERAIANIVIQMRRHGVGLDELKRLGGLERPGERDGSYDPIFGWR